MAEYDQLLKIIVIGHNTSGKSSLISRYTSDVFNESYTGTVGVDFSEKEIEHQGNTIKLQIWDTSGRKIFKSITNSYLGGCHGIMVVFDVADRSTYDRIFELFRDIESNGPKGVPTLLVGNKCDLTVVRCVTEEEAKLEADFFNMKYIETSAEENINVSKAFETLCEKMYANISKQVTLKDKEQIETLSKFTGSKTQKEKNSAQPGRNNKPAYVQKIVKLMNESSDTRRKLNTSSTQLETNGNTLGGDDVPEYAKRILKQIAGLKEKLESVDKLENAREAIGEKVDKLETKVKALEAKRKNNSNTKICMLL